MVCVNSFILWNFTKTRRDQISHGEFLEKLSNELVTYIPPNSEPTRRSMKFMHSLNTSQLPIYGADAYNTTLHTVSILRKGEGYDGADCNQKRCAHPLCKKSSRYYCTECELHFCTNSKQFDGRQTCFQNAHSDPEVWEKIKKKVMRMNAKEHQQSRQERRALQRQHRSKVQNRKRKLREHKRDMSESD